MKGKGGCRRPQFDLVCLQTQKPEVFMQFVRATSWNSQCGILFTQTTKVFLLEKRKKHLTEKERNKFVSDQSAVGAVHSE